MPAKILPAALALLLPARPQPATDAPADLVRVGINDNSRAAGTLVGSTQNVDLTIGRTRWFPEAEDGPSVEALAFGEIGKELTIPGPMIRVTAGTNVRVTISNPFADTLTVRGLYTRPGAERAVVVPPGGREEVEFSAPPGTYFYWGSIRGAQLGRRRPDESQLSGAIIVDAPGAKRRDRVFIIGIRLQLPDSTAAGKTPFHEAMVINGKAWPHTERLHLTQGDSVFCACSIRPARRIRCTCTGSTFAWTAAAAGRRTPYTRGRSSGPL